jgi:Ecdysteroid kinase-like family
VDYQESYWGSPGIDINHFLYTSCNYDVHDKHFDELISFYHEQLSLTLKKLNYSKIPSLNDVHYEVKNKAQQGLISLLSVVAIQMIENPEHANPENLVTDSDEAQAIRREVYGNPRYVELLKQMLPKIIDRGILSQVESHF